MKLIKVARANLMNKRSSIDPSNSLDSISLATQETLERRTKIKAGIIFIKFILAF